MIQNPVLYPMFTVRSTLLKWKRSANVSILIAKGHVVYDHLLANICWLGQIECFRIICTVIFIPFERSWTVLCHRIVCVLTYAPPPRNATGNKLPNLEAQILAYMHVDKVSSFVCQFSYKLSTSLTFIFKIKDSNKVHCEIHTWLSRKPWQIAQTLL